MNILLQSWELPPFNQISEADYEPAIEQAIALADNRIQAIVDNPESPTFANTIEPLEVADAELNRITALLFNLDECCTTDKLQDVVMRVQPELTRFNTRVATNRKLFNRVKQVHDSWPTDADPEQTTLVEQTYRNFERHGVGLEGEARKRFASNAEELAQLTVAFGQNALADLNEWTLHLTDVADLDGLPQSAIDAAHDEAQARQLDGWVFTLDAPSYGPFITYSRHRHLRERIYRAHAGIGNHGGAHDNNATINRIVALRTEQAHLLGYDTYCDYVLCDRMVQSLPRLQQFLDDLRQAVLPAAKADLEAVKSQSSQDDIRPWDFSFYAEQLKQKRFNIDSEALRPYFSLDNVRQGIFSLYGRLYGITFTPDPTVPVYHPDVQVFRVSDGARHMGLLYLDMHPRASKRSGAWMTEFRGQHAEVRPQIQVVCNFSKPVNGQPALLRFDEVETFMHEMGHAMHGLLSDVRYESLSGTNVKRDFVEMPSQVMENWCYEEEFLSTFARHYKTGEPLPQHLVDSLRQSRNHMAGWLCLRQLNLAQTDVAFHTLTAPTPLTAEQIEHTAMTHLITPEQGCCTATNFGHIFGGGYASGYYGYKWAEVLDADIFSRFKADGIFNATTARQFRDKILSRGGTRHPALLFRDFMGHDPDNTALLRRMQLTNN
ncbi:MAG: M3 family metallopeptidase [Bacteroidales bacterium]|nr:M3 family metallopeptidase [Bacteroidales bacterium]